MSVVRKRRAWPAVAGVLIKARDIIAKRGLLRGGWGTRGGPVCAVGAINEVTCGNPTFGSPTGDKTAYNALRDAITEPDAGWCNIVTWSDWRGQAEVLEGFDLAISCALDGAACEDLP